MAAAELAEAVDARLAALMRAVVQRAASASVTVDGEVVGALDRPGLMVLVGVTHTDTAATAAKLAAKIWTLRILADERSASDTHAPVLVVSQFTLYADTAKGRRPSWGAAAPRPRERAAGGDVRRRPCAIWAPRWPPGSSVPTCRSAWSTTDRSP